MSRELTSFKPNYNMLKQQMYLYKVTYISLQ